MTGTERKILIVDDEKELRDVLATTFEETPYEVILAEDGHAGLRAFYEHRPDLVVLDIIMPDLSGWSVLERIRELSDTPVIMLTALDQEEFRIQGLTGGADDYLAKPFSTTELVARCDAVLRRSGPSIHRDVYTDGLLNVDFQKQEVRVGADSVTLTPTEYRLLSLLIKSPGAVLSTDALQNHAWGVGYGSPESLRVYVSNLRKKLGLGDGALETVRGFGYRYVPPQ